MNTVVFDKVLCRLPAEEYDLFRRYCLEGETLLHLSETTGESLETIRQRLCLLRQTLLDLLIQSGVAESEALNYLYQTLTLHY